MSDKFIVRVRHSKGTTRMELVSKSATTIEQLKQLISEKLSDKPCINTQQLTANGKSTDIPFQNSSLLSSLNIKHGSMFYLKIIESNDANSNTNTKNGKRKLNEIHSLQNPILPPIKRARLNDESKHNSNNNCAVISEKKANQSKPFQSYDFMTHLQKYERECKKVGLSPNNNIPSLHRNGFWLFVDNPFNNKRSQHCGKWMIYASKNKLFYTNLNRHELIDWKCNHCHSMNKPWQSVCSHCFNDKMNKTREELIDCHMITHLDMQWLRVVKHTLNGNLGNISAKVSTSCDGYGGNGVIIIYTYDWTDKTDVLNVAQNITKVLNRKRGFCYKTDESTRNGQYSANSNGEVSKYKYQPKNPNTLIETAAKRKK